LKRFRFVATVFTLIMISVWSSAVAVYASVNGPYNAVGGHALYDAPNAMYIPVSLGSNVSAIFNAPPNKTLGFEETTDPYDYTGAGYMIGHRSGSKVTFTFNDAKRVTQSGPNASQLNFNNYTNAVVIGHGNTNPTIMFYENHGFTHLATTTSQNAVSIMYSGKSVLNVPMANITSGNDFFTMEAFQDGTHVVLVFWGVGAQGALASGVYFDTQFMGMSALTSQAYVFHWQDTNQNGIPDSGDKFTVVFPITITTVSSSTVSQSTNTIVSSRQGGSTSVPEIPIQSFGLLVGAVIVLACLLFRRKKIAEMPEL
jgi:hypothetical protein